MSPVIDYGKRTLALGFIGVSVCAIIGSVVIMIAMCVNDDALSADYDRRVFSTLCNVTNCSVFNSSCVRRINGYPAGEDVEKCVAVEANVFECHRSCVNVSINYTISHPPNPNITALSASTHWTQDLAYRCAHHTRCFVDLRRPLVSLHEFPPYKSPYIPAIIFSALTLAMSAIILLFSLCCCDVCEKTPKMSSATITYVPDPDDTNTTLLSHETESEATSTIKTVSDDDNAIEMTTSTDAGSV